MDKASTFLASRIGQDALTIADLLQQLAAKDKRIAELEAEAKPAHKAADG